MTSMCKNGLCLPSPLCLCYMVLVVLILVLIQSWRLEPFMSVPSKIAWDQQTSRNISLYVKPNIETLVLGPSSPCQDDPYLLIIVPSSIKNVQQRSAIRKSWGQWSLTNTSRNNSFKIKENIKLFFLLGMDPYWEKIPNQLKTEYSEFRDILIEDFSDTYYNLTLKSVFMLKWISRYCNGAKYVMKIDDDMFINVPNALKAINEEKQKDKLLLGSLICNAKPIQKPSSKWFSPNFMFPGRKYPNYLSGTAYIFSGDLVEPLLKTALATPYFHLEDIFLTGICTAKLHIKPRDHLGFFFYRRPINPCIYKDIISGHEVNPTNLIKMWNLINNPSTLTKCNLSQKILFPPHDVKNCVWKSSTLPREFVNG